MSRYYYEALPKERGHGLSAEKSLRISEAWMNRAMEALGPFYRYVTTAINTAHNKQEIMAQWEQVDHADLLLLHPITKIYRIPKRSTIRIRNNEPGTYRIIGAYLEEKNQEWDAPLRVIDGDNKLKIDLEPAHLLAPDHIRHPGLPHKTVKANWGFESFTLEPCWAILTTKSQVEVDGKQTMVLEISGDVITLAGHVGADAAITAQGITLTYGILSTAQPPKMAPLRETPDAWWISSEVQLQDGNEIPPQEYTSFFNRNELLLESGGKPLESTADEDLSLGIRIADANAYQGKVVKSKSGLRFRLDSLKKNERARHWIQLLEPEETGDEQPGLSPLRYFFDDDIEITDEQGKFYKIVEGIESERKLLLAPRGARKHDTCFPDGRWLRIKVNTHPLKMQRNAVTALQNKPVKAQRKLIQLLENRDRVQWPHPARLDRPLQWQVLTDDQRDDTAEQRRFVELAMQTPDFAILEGPPGSGKTTVILELICQLIQRGKRVLLCGSTHVAIDNVLERLKSKGLLLKNTILPVRIGDENRISDSVKEFQLDRMRDDTHIEEALLLAAANLVCGTTIGILQHPSLKQKQAQEDQAAPIVPSFDYLIIDECSKTTFQEFLVPAMFAQHWILVGDVRQLSPFTDREQLSSNIANLELKEGKTLSLEHQAACFYLHQLAELRPGFDSFRPAICVTSKVAECMAMELAAGLTHPGLAGKVIAILGQTLQDQPAPSTYSLLPIPDLSKMPLAAAADILILNHQDYIKAQDRLPVGMTVLLQKDWTSSSHAFRTVAASSFGKIPKVQYRNQETVEHTEIAERLKKDLGERTWADEIAWRIDREHQLRMKGEKRSAHYRKAIEDMMPRALPLAYDLVNRIDTIGQVALPSILELLERGITLRHRDTPTTLSAGFTPAEKHDRHIQLSYQQRMHPHISEFPRAQFYEGQALRDMQMPSITQNRNWAYAGYRHRSAWVHVNGKTHKNFNRDEVTVVIKELSAFLSYARNTPPPPSGRDRSNVWEVACLTFYRGQEAHLREALRKLSNSQNAFSKFIFPGHDGIEVHVLLHTVDKFQGQEADIVFLSMVQTRRDGFLDSPNRLNVAITRARFQLVIIGNQEYFSRSYSGDLKALALHHRPHTQHT